MNPIESCIEYKLISEFYGERRAERSQVLLMNHINEGIKILQRIYATTPAMLAFAIHPLLQSDGDLAMEYPKIARQVDVYALGLAMEYRSVANEYLSHRSINHISEIRLSPLKSVNDMLVADKVQNYKDFILYHHGTHPRSKELHQYFRNWLEKLDCEYVMDEVFPEWRNYDINA